MNIQQESLLSLLEIARDDILAGRSAEETSGALRAALSVTTYDDLKRGLADDENWRKIRIG